MPENSTQKKKQFRVGPEGEGEGVERGHNSVCWRPFYHSARLVVGCLAMRKFLARVRRKPRRSISANGPCAPPTIHCNITTDQTLPDRP